MNGFKNLFASKAIITTIIGALFALAHAFGLTDSINLELQNGIVAALFALAGFFRFTATEQLTTASTPPNTLTP